MTTRHRVAAVATLAAAFVCACASGHKPEQSSTPGGRSRESEIDEIRIRHNDIVDALRANDVGKIARQLTATAVLILPSRDTVRGAPAITAQIEKLFKAFKIEAVRATAAVRMEQCRDGVLERSGDWSLQLLKPDKTRDFKRDTFGVRWTLVDDSLRISMISLISQKGLTPSETHCVSPGG